MDTLRRVSIKGEHYYYVHHIVEHSGRVQKFKCYLGKKKPTKSQIESFKKSFTKTLNLDPNFLSHYDRKNIIAVLQDAQEKEGYLSEETLIKLSKEFDIPASKLYGVATFYSQFNLSKPGKYKISVCKGTACHVKNSTALINYLEDYLKIKSGETTKDGLFTLECVNCIGACARAPAMMVNEVVHGELTEKKIKQILGGLK